MPTPDKSTTARPRRDNGEGTAPYETKDGRWRAEIIVGWRWVGDKQRPKRKIVYGATKRECQTKLRQALRQRDDGTLVAGRVPTVEEWLTHWLDAVAAQRVRPSTLQAYRSLLQTWIIPAVGRRRLDKLTAEDLDRAYQQMREAGRADSMILKAHRVVSRALKVAVQRGRLGVTPATLMDSPSVERPEATPLSADDARAILTAATTPPAHSGPGRPSEGLPNAARWTVALALGVRQGEALGLCWDMVDLDAGTLKIRRALVRRLKGTPTHLGPLKTSASKRTVLMPDGLVKELRRHRREQLLVRVQEGPNWVGYEQDGREFDLVFTNRDGRPINHSVDAGNWRKLLERAGVPRARLHDTRHTAATMMLVQGIPARTVMDIRGHSTINMTLNTYSHVVPELARDAAARMNDVLYGKTPTKTPTKRADGERGGR